MRTYLIKRCIYAVITLFGVTLVAFGLLNLQPGDPAELLLGVYATEETIQQLHKELRLDDPLYAQYLGFLSNLFSGQLESIFYKQPAHKLILHRFLATLELTCGALFIAVIISMSAGIISAIKRDTFFDFSTSAISLFGISMPDFWLGTMLILLFSVTWNIFPGFGYGEMSSVEAMFRLVQKGKIDGILTFLHHLSLPALTLSAHIIGVVTRVIRTSMLDEINKDYVIVLRSKGLSEWAVVLKHMFRNSLLPVITIFSMQFVKLLGGAVIVETIFSWPGVGYLMVEAIFSRDYSLVQAGIVFFSFLCIFVNLAVDLLYSFIDPRIKY